MFKKRIKKLSLRVTASGRLCNVKKQTAQGSGKEFVTASILDSVKNKEGEYESRFTNIVAFNNNAEYIARLDDKTAVNVFGDLTVRAYNDADGTPKANASIQVITVEKCPTSGQAKTEDIVEDSTPAPVKKSVFAPA